MIYDNSNILINGALSTSLIDNKISSSGKSTTTGAVNVFIGQVRKDIIDNKKVKSIIYTAYAEMVSKEAGLIINEMYSRYSDVNNIEIFHSTGIVPVGGISLIVIVMSGHRIQAFEALRETVELIKKRLPVWKQEIFEDGSYRWPSNNNTTK